MEPACHMTFLGCKPSNELTSGCTGGFLRGECLGFA